MSKILIVDDEAHILRVMSLWLTRHGHDVLEASNGQQAVTHLDRGEVDLIISDVNMPVLDGLGLVKTVREDRSSRVPFLLLSARCDQDRLRAQVTPYDVHLYPKPFVPSQLVSEIDRLLEPTADAARLQPVRRRDSESVPGAAGAKEGDLTCRA